MKEETVYGKLEEITRRDPRFSLRSYFFILAAVDYCLSRLRERRHLSGQELCEGIRDFAIMTFGPMTSFVFECWGIRACRDFGEIVYNLIDMNILTRSSRDRIEDFDDVYEFSDAFRYIEQPLPADFLLRFVYEKDVPVGGFKLPSVITERGTI